MKAHIRYILTTKHQHVYKHMSLTSIFPFNTTFIQHVYCRNMSKHHTSVKLKCCSSCPSVSRTSCYKETLFLLTLKCPGALWELLRRMITIQAHELIQYAVTMAPSESEKSPPSEAHLINLRCEHPPAWSQIKRQRQDMQE